MASRKIYLARNVEDVDVSGGVNDGEVLVWDSGSGDWIPSTVSGASGATTFLDLTDVPDDYATYSGYFVRVTDTEDGLIFDTVSAEANIAIQEDDAEIVATLTTLNFEGRDIVDVVDEGGGKATVTISGGATVLNELADVTVQSLIANQLIYYNAASGWINDNIPAEFLSNVTITDPSENEFLAYDADLGQWVNRAALLVSDLFLHDEASDIGGYHKLLSDPPNASEVEDQVSVTSASGVVLIDAYATDTQIGTTLLPGGSWHFVTFASVNNTGGDSNITIRVYLREAGGTENLLGEVVTADINSITAVELEKDLFIADTICNIDDRIVIKYYGSTTAPTQRIISLFHEGQTHYSHIHLPFILDSTSGVTTFTGLTDTPSSYSSQGGKLVAVNAGEDALEFVPSGVYPTAFLGLGDTPSDYSGQSGKVAAVKSTEDGLEFVVASGAGASAFTDLSDVPSSYSGEGGKVVSVKDTEDGLEFTTVSGSSGGGALLSAFRASLSSDWTPGGTDAYYKVSFDVEELDFGDDYDPTTNYRWTPPSGIIHIAIVTEWANINTNRAYTALYKNGALVANANLNRYPQSLQLDYIDLANGSDYYEVWGLRGAFSNGYLLDGSGNFFQGTCLSDV